MYSNRCKRTTPVSYTHLIAINNKYINYLKEKIIPIKNSTEFLEYLYKKQYEIYIVTNSPIEVVNDKVNKINAQK